jgi:hypothetical protein
MKPPLELTGKMLLREDSLMAVIIIIPIAVGMPTMPVFIPPSMLYPPAALPRLVQFMAPLHGLFALVSVMPDGFVQLVVHARDASLTIVLIGAQVWCAGKHQEPS